MPNKTIYVADADLAVFERAQELAGENLSATIVQALHRFVETEEARARGFDLITVKVGNKGMYSQKQFNGRELAKQRVRDENQPRLTTSVVFQTAKGRFVLYVHSSPDWSAWTTFWARDWEHDWDVDVDVDVDVDMYPGARAWERREARRHEHRPERGRGRTRQHFDWPIWPSWATGSDYTMEVFDTLEELKPHISEELYASVEHALRGEEVEFLDI